MNCKLAWVKLCLPLLFGIALSACSDLETTAETSGENDSLHHLAALKRAFSTKPQRICPSTRWPS